MKVITLSKNYMKGHFREGEATFFKSKFIEGSKKHTIRANEKGYFKDGEILSVRQWKDKPYASKQVEIGITPPICLEPIEMEAHRGNMTLCQTVVGGVVTKIDWEELALHDGLDRGEFFDWFFPKGFGTFNGDILHFTDKRYADEK